MISCIEPPHDLLSWVERRHSLSPEDRAQTGFLHVQYFYIYKLGMKFSSDIHDSQRMNICGFGDFFNHPLVCCELRYRFTSL